MKSSRRNCRTQVRHGLTLLELVVVVAVLAALAAMLIPMFPNMTTQAHTAAAATNVGEVAKAVQAYNAQTNLYPNNLDSLVDGSGKLVTILPNNQMMFTNSQIYLDLVPTIPSTTDVAALNNVGITSVLNMTNSATSSVTDSVWSPTYYPYGDGSGGMASTPVATAISTGSKLVQLSQNAAQRLGLIPPVVSGGTAQVNTYYVFGLGGYSSMQGISIAEAPVHWMTNMTTNGATMNMTPSAVYSRFALVFQTSNAGVALGSARFVGTILLTGQGVANSSKPMTNFIGTQSSS